MIKTIILDCKNSLRNYAFVIIDTDNNDCALIDSLDNQIIFDYLHHNQLNLRYILNTHHHNDHVGGNFKLRDLYNCDIYGNSSDKHRIKGITHCVDAGHIISLFNNKLQFKIMSLDGHTVGHIGFYSEKKKWLFCGDTLFNLGCGRRFEGTNEQYYQTLQKISTLPSDTLIYATHEYTVDNIAFAKKIIPNYYHNYQEFLDYCTKQINKRINLEPTIPFILEEQLKFNPFLLVDNSIIRDSLNQNNMQSYELFGYLRTLKDNFLT